MKVNLFSLDEKGKFGIDVVIGLSILMVTLIFIAQYLPSIFSADKKEITTYPLAYRISCALTDNPGYWMDGNSEGYDWWNYPNHIVSIGLSNGEMGVLDDIRIDELNTLYNGGNNYDLIKNKLGMTESLEPYDYNISIQLVPSNIFSSEYATDTSGNKILTIGKPITDVGEIAIFEKRVYYDDYSSYITNFQGENTSFFDNSGVEVNHILVDPPVESFVIDIESLSDVLGPSPDLEVKVGSNILLTKTGSNCIDTFDITDEINSYTGQKNVKITTKNLKGFVISTNAGKFIGGRVVAKLVVVVW